MGRPSKNLSGPGAYVEGRRKERKKDALSPATRKNDYRWRDMRSFKTMRDVETTPLTEEQLNTSKCHRRTCRKNYTPTHREQVLCPKCEKQTKIEAALTRAAKSRSSK